MEDIVDVCVGAATPFENFVLVAGNLEALLVWARLVLVGPQGGEHVTLFDAHDRDVSVLDLVRRLEDSDGHFGRFWVV